jgi:YD repeat-containing protein
MARIFFLFSLVLVQCVFVFGQMLEPIQEGFLERLRFQPEFIASNNIRSVRTQAYKSYLSGRKAPVGLMESYEFDDNGNLLNFRRINASDTAEVQEFFYTEKGSLFHRIRVDKRQNKRYKSFFRYGSDHALFQEKAYEIMNKDELMLLGIRQYAYQADGKVAAIHWMKNDKPSRTQRFTYNKEGQVILELHFSAEGDTIKRVRYDYDVENRITRVHSENGQDEDYIYEYDEKGNLLSLKWLLDGRPSGDALFLYDDRSVLKSLQYNNIFDGNGPVVKEFQVAYYE